MHIPTVKVTSQRRVRGTEEQETVTEDRSRGFGFVQFLCPKDAACVVKVRPISLRFFEGVKSGDPSDVFVILKALGHKRFYMRLVSPTCVLGSQTRR